MPVRSLFVCTSADSIAWFALYSADLISPISTALRRPHDAIYTEQSLPPCTTVISREVVRDDLEASDLSHPTAVPPAPAPSATPSRLFPSSLDAVPSPATRNFSPFGQTASRHGHNARQRLETREESLGGFHEGNFEISRSCYTPR